MSKTDFKKRFVFNNKADDLYPLLTEMTDYLQHTVEINETERFKFKVVLTELLTNGIKHSNCSDTFIDITAIGPAITITKSDVGDTFTLNIDGTKREWPLPGRHIEKRSVKVYSNDNYSLLAKIENNYRISFFTEEQLLPALLDVTNLSEHFGLMIITKAADVFDYEYDIDNSTNKFVITIFLANL